ncbi:MAG: hypothetical protein HY791_23285 [Deltaproteobacteria bacterium]|nr:hypothetical protein [Deltaproteobacteria bacterium]
MTDSPCPRCPLGATFVDIVTRAGGQFEFLTDAAEGAAEGAADCGAFQLVGQTAEVTVALVDRP